jgi:hypothetical protein
MIPSLQPQGLRESGTPIIHISTGQFAAKHLSEVSGSLEPSSGEVMSSPVNWARALSTVRTLIFHSNYRLKERA